MFEDYNNENTNPIAALQLLCGSYKLILLLILLFYVQACGGAIGTGCTGTGSTGSGCTGTGPTGTGCTGLGCTGTGCTGSGCTGTGTTGSTGTDERCTLEFGCLK